MARTRSKSGRSSSKKKASKSGAVKTSLLVNADQALLMNIVLQAFYAAAFFGLTGADASTKFYGVAASAGPLCNSLPFWMGLMNVAYCASTLNCYLNGSAAEKANFCLVRSIQWAVWFCMIIMNGRQGFGGGMMVDQEYFTAVGVCFVASFLSKHGAEGAKTSSAIMDLTSVRGKVFAFLVFMQLFNTFNVGVMNGSEYFKAEEAQINAHCRADGGFFASFVFLMTMDIAFAMQVAKGKTQTGFLQTMAAINVMFVGATYMHKDIMPEEGVYFNYASSALVAGACYYASQN
jgi:hypothetical protein